MSQKYSNTPKISPLFRKKVRSPTEEVPKFLLSSRYECLFQIDGHSKQHYVFLGAGLNPILSWIFSALVLVIGRFDPVAPLSPAVDPSNKFVELPTFDVFRLVSFSCFTEKTKNIFNLDITQCSRNLGIYD